LDIFSSKDNSSDSVVGIDIGSSSIKVVQLKKKKSKAVLETYGAISLGPYGNTDIGSVTNLKVDEISKANKIQKTIKVLLDSFIIRFPFLFIKS
jgi:Tfp pilus assembly PilM family ATPase